MRGRAVAAACVSRAARRRAGPTSDLVPLVFLKVTSDKYDPTRSSVNGSGFRPFDMVIPFSFRKGEITGEATSCRSDGLSLVARRFFLRRWLRPSFTGEVLMPSGKSAQPLITDNLDGTVTVQYSPTEAGLHEMHIKYNGTHIPGQRAVTVTPARQKRRCVSG